MTRAPGAANNPDRLLILCVGVGGLIFVPIFRMLTGLAPFMGILLALGVLWLVSEYRCNRNALFCESSHLKVTTLLSRIDMATILFFLGILLAVATLQETGVLTSFGAWLNEASDGNHYLVTGIIGVVSSIVDNVPLVAGCMEMYPIAPQATLASTDSSGSCWPTVPAWAARCSSSVRPQASWSWVWRKSASDGICAASPG